MIWNEVLRRYIWRHVCGAKSPRGHQVSNFELRKLKHFQQRSSNVPATLILHYRLFYLGDYITDCVIQNAMQHPCHYNSQAFKLRYFQTHIIHNTFCKPFFTEQLTDGLFFRLPITSDTKKTLLKHTGCRPRLSYRYRFESALCEGCKPFVS